MGVVSPSTCLCARPHLRMRISSIIHDSVIVELRRNSWVQNDIHVSHDCTRQREEIMQVVFMCHRILQQDVHYIVDNRFRLTPELQKV